MWEDTRQWNILTPSLRNSECLEGGACGHQWACPERAHLLTLATGSPWCNWEWAFPLLSHSCLGRSSVLGARPMYPAFLPGTIPYTSFQKVPWDPFCPESYCLETGSSVSKTECKQCSELEVRDTCEQTRINHRNPVSGLGCSLRSLLEHCPPTASHRASLRLDVWEESFPSWFFWFLLWSPIPRLLLLSFQNLNATAMIVYRRWPFRE